MDGHFFLATLALVPYFTSRAMIPLFASAAIARLASEWLGDGSAIARFAGIQLLDGLPAWFTSDTALVVLGIFALVEVVALKNPELREVISLGDAEAKALVVALLCLALATGATAGSGPVTPTEAGTPMLTAGALPDWIAESGVLPTAGFTFAHLWALLVGAATWALASLRRSIYRLLREVDEDDDLGVQGQEQVRHARLHGLPVEPLAEGPTGQLAAHAGDQGGCLALSLSVQAREHLDGTGVAERGQLLH
jgi:hypothetical protein